ncbi:predicted protein [Chaetomium globosum CBS 148.51]|uniref:Uncharacterized protein n=1 Tax=Chaetomium globosum (strain ATCC 6205 / CBS 148.51 / DSM 1962 / NBRC 6347 / NRRL 1970) TaxID=306901 RepID=Q2GN72_CHAGB|nr:uncharacterized protein CHGG_10582 [Chaetomium globosum CBS 148.51]EAQ84178.1 predicted protein [Chaetomium globosum CBS 148.51]
MDIRALVNNNKSIHTSPCAQRFYQLLLRGLGRLCLLIIFDGWPTGCLVAYDRCTNTSRVALQGAPDSGKTLHVGRLPDSDRPQSLASHLTHVQETDNARGEEQWKACIKLIGICLRQPPGHQRTSPDGDSLYSMFSPPPTAPRRLGGRSDIPTSATFNKQIAAIQKDATNKAASEKTQSSGQK